MNYSKNQENLIETWETPSAGIPERKVLHYPTTLENVKQSFLGLTPHVSIQSSRVLLESGKYLSCTLSNSSLQPRECTHAFAISFNRLIGAHVFFFSDLKQRPSHGNIPNLGRLFLKCLFSSVCSSSPGDASGI